MTIQRSIKKAMQNPEAVTGLDLRQVKPTTLFPEIELFINLEFIDLSNCTSLDWKDACIKLAKLPKLTEIKAFGADITILPEEFGLMSNLKKIDFSSNASLEKLPAAFSALICLEDINLYGCGLTTLPQTSWHFPDLHTLTLSRNKIETIPANFFNGMTGLQQLFIADNQIKELPESIGSLKELTVLYAGSNPLNNLPTTFASLNKLNTLWLDTCPEIDFDKTLVMLKPLPIRDLCLLGNNINIFPQALKEMNALEILNINSNNLHDTRQLLKDLSTTNIKKLDIRFMGTEDISLQEARMILPTLEEISCDTRSTEQFSADITSWLSKQLVV